MTLSNNQIARYSRQLILPELGVQGQERLARSAVLVVGAGGLGSPAALYLAAAGVGALGLIDSDAVSLSNLHRQILHGTDDVGRPKTLSAQARLAALNPQVRVRAMHERLEARNARALAATYDLVLDGSDNFATRYLVNDACVLERTPLIYGGVVRLAGQLLVIRPGQSACFRCVFPEPPGTEAVPNCQQAGVLGSAAGVIGSLMAHEALKWLAGIGEPLTDRLLVFEGQASRFREVPVRRDPGCAVCGETPTVRTLASLEGSACQETADSARLSGRTGAVR